MISYHFHEKTVKVNYRGHYRYAIELVPINTDGNICKHVKNDGRYAIKARINEHTIDENSSIIIRPHHLHKEIPCGFMIKSSPDIDIAITSCPTLAKQGIFVCGEDVTEKENEVKINVMNTSDKDFTITDGQIIGNIIIYRNRPDYTIHEFISNKQLHVSLDITQGWDLDKHHEFTPEGRATQIFDTFESDHPISDQWLRMHLRDTIPYPAIPRELKKDGLYTQQNCGGDFDYWHDTWI